MASELPPAQANHDSTTASMRLDQPWLNLARVVWIVLVVITVALFMAGLGPMFQDTQTGGAVSTDALRSLHLSPQLFAGYRVALEVLRMLAFSVAGLLIFWRKPDKLGIFVSLMLITFGVGLASSAVYYTAGEYPALAWPVALIQGLGNGMLLIFLFVFPDGRFTPSWTPPVAVLWLVVAIYMQLPIGIFAGDGREGAYFGVSMVFYLTGLVAQHQRVQRNPHAAHLQQRKWVLIGLVFSLIGYIISAVSGFIPALNQPAPTAPGLVIYWALVMLICMTLFQMMIPLTIGFSIMRYRLWEVDVIINRTAVYGALTALLVAAFMADLYVAQKILDRLLGGDQAPFALAISALVAGALFQPVRRRLQRYMDRRIFHISPPGTAGGTPTTGSFSGLISGVQLGPYEVQEPLGQGGMAIVYRGRHTTLNRPVAIKVLSARTMANDNMRLRFEREAQTVAALNHPNIVRVFDFGHYEGMPYMVMELIDGEDLATLIRDSGPLTLDLVGPVARDIASALDYAHAQGVIHRDVKPSNVLLQPDRASEEPRYRSILTDFGIAKIRTGQTGLTKTGTIGTLDYMAPEQIVSARAVDARADIYAFGAMLFQMLTGELPFKADNPGAIVLACLQQPAPDPRTINPDIPEPIALALLQALEKDPRARFATAGALASKLQE